MSPLPLLLALVSASPAGEMKAELVDVRKIWDAAPHCAFTDLIRFRDTWFCTFREADTHAGSRDGAVCVLRSPDGERWESAAIVAEAGIDLRDPKLSITPDGRLMLLCGGSVYEGKVRTGRQPRVAFSEDGTTWTPPRRVLAEGDWLWRLTWHEGTGYGVSYRGDGTSAELYRTRDGLDYERVGSWDVPGAGETTLRVLPDGTMIALVRREADDRHGRTGRSSPPYSSWTWTDAGLRLGGPNFLELPDGRLVAGTRFHGPDGPRTILAAMTPTTPLDPILTLPSSGDTSYPGLVWHDGLLWVSYYSSHEGGRTAVYLARIRIQP